MRNPLRSEAEAYRFLLLTVGYFALIVAASLVNRWLGLAVFLALTLAVLYLALRRRPGKPIVQAHAERRGEENERRILVLANETVGGAELRERIREKAEGYRESVLVVCPALNSPVRHWASDDAGARCAAEERLRSSLDRLAAAGVDARGEVGDGEPLQALEDTVRSFGPDEIIISTHPEGRSHWLERNVVERARERFECPITHVVVDLEAERETSGL